MWSFSSSFDVSDAGESASYGDYVIFLLWVYIFLLDVSGRYLYHECRLLYKNLMQLDKMNQKLKIFQ